MRSFDLGSGLAFRLDRKDTNHQTLLRIDTEDHPTLPLATISFTIASMKLVPTYYHVFRQDID